MILRSISLKHLSLKSQLRHLLLSAVILMSLFPANGALTFAPSSRLSSGKWVKFAVITTGIYEITYEKLASLGFSDPGKVGVFGRGGEELPLNLTNGVGNPLIETDVTPINVLHLDDRIVFYAQGPENIKWKKTTDLPETGGRFSNSGMNFYSYYGWYFLTDSYTQEMEPAASSQRMNLPQITTGQSYAYHEYDLCQGPNNSGKELWGESFVTSDKRTQEFPVALMGKTGAQIGAIECVFMSNGYSAGTLDYGLDMGNCVTSSVPGIPSGTYFMLNSKKYGPCGIAENDSTVTVSYKSSSTVTTAFLDYFLVTYTRRLKLQESEMWFISHAKALSRSVIPTDDQDLMVLDITEPGLPMQLERSEEGFEFTGDKTLLFFSLSSKFPSPSFYFPMENQDLHALPTTNNPEMLIVHTEELKDVANDFVQFHARKGEEVLAVPITKIYNEYSSGCPDPMAVRLFAKSFYDKEDSKLKALLLMGQTMAFPKFSPDLTGRLILPQSETGAYSTDTYGFLDLYGMTDSFFSNKLALRPIRLATGVLPFSSSEEGKNYLKKIETFNNDSTLHQWADNTLFMCDDNNKGMHLISVENLISGLNEYSGHRLNTIKNYLGETGPQYMLPYWMSQANRGMLYSLYMGHGALFSIGSWEFYKPGYFKKFKNDRLGFMIFSGCMTTGYETLRSGVGESLILKSSYGLFGGLVTARSVWAQDNHNLVNRFHNELFVAADSTWGCPPTLGEALLNAKNKEENTNKFNFHLMCDPLIRIPVPLLDIRHNFSAVVFPGKEYNMTGTIAPEGEAKLAGFNGKVSIKWHTPATSRKPRSLYSNDNLDMTLDFDQDIVEIQEGTVHNGYFNINLICPDHLRKFAGSDVTVSMCAFDPNLRVTAAKKIKVRIASSTADSNDNTPPSIESFGFEDTAGYEVTNDAVVHIYITDESGVRCLAGSSLSNLSLTIDGHAVESLEQYVSAEEAGREVTIRMPLPPLKEGYHSMGIDVFDYKGNKAHSYIDFKILSTVLESTPAVRTGAFTEEVEFDIPEELLSLENARMNIYNNLGEVIWSAPLSKSGRWLLKDKSGGRVPAGVYHAVVTGESSNGTPVCSRKVALAVLKGE